MGNIVGAIVLGVIAIICFVFTRLYNFINRTAVSNIDVLSLL